MKVHPTQMKQIPRQVKRDDEHFINFMTADQLIFFVVILHRLSCTKIAVSCPLSYMCSSISFSAINWELSLFKQSDAKRRKDHDTAEVRTIYLWRGLYLHEFILYTSQEYLQYTHSDGVIITK